MFNVLIIPLFEFVARLISQIFTPVTTALSSVFSIFTTVFQYLYQFLSMGLTYFVFFCQLFMVPSGALIMFFSFLGVIIVFNAVLWVVGITVAIYRFIRGGSA